MEHQIASDLHRGMTDFYECLLEKLHYEKDKFQRLINTTINELTQDHQKVHEEYVNNSEKWQTQLVAIDKRLREEQAKNSNIKDLEAKWNELKEFKNKLDLLSYTLKLEQEGLAKEKLKLAEDKIDFEKNKVDADMKTSKLDGNFMQFVNDKKVEQKVEPKVESKVEEKVEEKVELKVEPKVEQKVELKVEPKVEPKVEQKVDKELEYDLVSLIQSYPLELKNLEDKQKTEQVCKWAIHKNMNALEFVPKNMLNKIYMYLFLTYDNVLNIVPKHLITQELCNMAIEYGLTNFRKIPLEFRTEELCNLIMAQYGDYEWKTEAESFLKNIPEKFLTKGMCETIVGQNGLELFGVPEELKTVELCKVAYKNNKTSIKYMTKTLMELVY